MVSPTAAHPAMRFRNDSSAKCGLEGMSDALRIELMLFGIDVVMIEPGTVNTAM